MNKSRVEAFSDGVIAIIITIVVLLFDLPEGDDWGSLAKILPLFFATRSALCCWRCPLCGLSPTCA